MFALLCFNLFVLIVDVVCFTTVEYAYYDYSMRFACPFRVGGVSGLLAARLHTHV